MLKSIILFPSDFKISLQFKTRKKEKKQNDKFTVLP